MVYGCIQNMDDESQIFLSIGEISIFSELLNRTADILEVTRSSGKRPKESNAVIEVYASADKARKRSYKATPLLRNYEQRLDVPPIPIARSQVMEIVDEWFEDRTLRSRTEKETLSEKQLKDPAYCVLHRTRKHNTMDC